MATVIGVVANSAKPNSGGGGGGYGTITGYYNSSGLSGRFCARLGNQAVTVYYAGSGTKTFSEVYNSGSTIFSNTALTTSASSGIYGTQNGGSGYGWFEWQAGSGWVSTDTCS